MKVLSEIIRHLVDEGVIPQEASDALNAKGYHGYSSDKSNWEPDDSLEMDRLREESIEDERALSLEKSLEDKRRRKQGRKARFKGAKKRHKRNYKLRNMANASLINRGLTYTCFLGFTFSEDVLNKVKQLPIKNVERLDGLRHEYYPECYLFWDSLAEIIGEEQIIEYNDPLVRIFSESNEIEKYSIDELDKEYKNYSKSLPWHYYEVLRKNRFLEYCMNNSMEYCIDYRSHFFSHRRDHSAKKLIQPYAFFMLRNEEFIQNTEDWELILKIDDKEVLITNAIGEFKK